MHILNRFSNNILKQSIEIRFFLKNIVYSRGKAHWIIQFPKETNSLTLPEITSYFYPDICEISVSISIRMFRKNYIDLIIYF